MAIYTRWGVPVTITAAREEQNWNERNQEWIPYWMVTADNGKEYPHYELTADAGLGEIDAAIQAVTVE